MRRREAEGAEAVVGVLSGRGRVVAVVGGGERAALVAAAVRVRSETGYGGRGERAAAVCVRSEIGYGEGGGGRHTPGTNCPNFHRPHPTDEK
jgi:hypothetical protein